MYRQHGQLHIIFFSLHSVQALSESLDCSHFLMVVIQGCFTTFPTNANCEHDRYEHFQGSSMQGGKIFLCGICVETPVTPGQGDLLL